MHRLGTLPWRYPSAHRRTDRRPVSGSPAAHAIAGSDTHADRRADRRPATHALASAANHADAAAHAVADRRGIHRLQRRTCN